MPFVACQLSVAALFSPDCVLYYAINQVITVQCWCCSGSCDFWQHIAHAWGLLSHYCNHVSDCSVQCAIENRDRELLYDNSPFFVLTCNWIQITSSSHQWFMTNSSCCSYVYLSDCSLSRHLYELQSTCNYTDNLVLRGRPTYTTIQQRVTGALLHTSSMYSGGSRIHRCNCLAPATPENQMPTVCILLETISARTRQLPYVKDIPIQTFLVTSPAIPGFTESWPM